MDENVIRPFDRPLKERAGFRVLTGNIFHSAVMKMSVISPEFRERYLSNPDASRTASRAAPWSSTGRRTTTTASTTRALAIDENTMLFMRGAGPKGYPGAAEVVNMRAPDYLLKQGDHQPRLHRRRPAVGHLRLALDPERLARRRRRAAGSR